MTTKYRILCILGLCLILSPFLWLERSLPAVSARLDGSVVSRYRRISLDDPAVTEYAIRFTLTARGGDAYVDGDPARSVEWSLYPLGAARPDEDTQTFTALGGRASDDFVFGGRKRYVVRDGESRAFEFSVVATADDPGVLPTRLGIESIAFADSPTGPCRGRAALVPYGLVARP